jgi:NADH-quinone oxidoreductase subunit N
LAIYNKEPNEEATKTPFVFYAVAVISILMNIVLGLFPSVVLDLLG